MSVIDPADVARRLDQLRNDLDAIGGDHVEIVAVTKGFGPDAAQAAITCGLTVLGENYAQELVAKAEHLLAAGEERETAPEWHFIGHLQSNKVASLAPHVAVWQTVDRLKLGTRIAAHSPGSRVYVQVNVTDEPQKAGCQPHEVGQLVADLTSLDLDVQGLMTVGRQGDVSETRSAFDHLVSLADDLELPTRSMGMSADYAVAVAAGSTMLRIGSKLFGPRPPKATP